MLEIWRCTGPEAKREHFAKADPRRDSWVVPDLQSKWHIQRQWLAQYGVLEQTSVIRATELWKQLAFQVRPDVRLLSQELAQTMIWNWVEPRRLSFARTPQSVAVIQKQMQMWVSVFAARDYKEVMGEWFEANPRAVERWGHWFVLCSELWEWFNERGLMLKEWLPGLLLNEELEGARWSKRLIFDVGAQVSQVEGQLIQQLARRMDVAVVYPEAPWTALMPETMRPYEVLLDKPYKGISTWQPECGGHMTFGRFTTQLSEVKDAVARVRQWLDQGVSPEDIAITAPDIEAYWPALRLYLGREGVPVHKATTAKVGGMLEMSRWLAALRTSLQKVKSADLEMSLFGMNDAPALQVSEFRRLFSHIYDEADLKRAENLFSRKARLNASEQIPLQDFLSWALGHWPDSGDLQRLENLLGVAGQEVPYELQLPANEWLSYFEGLLARREETLERAAAGGVWCVSISSAHWMPATHGIILNMNEAALRSLERSPVSAGEAAKILQDTGFALGPVEHQQLEFELLWFWQRPWRELRLTFAGHDFQGQVLTPSRLWMWSALANGQFKKDPEAPKATRWDELQRVAEASRAGLRQGLERDETGAGSHWSKTAGGSFSASRLERFWECPFVFAAQKRLHLSDDPALDLDLDRRTRGRLLHAILDKLTAEPVRFDWSEEELLQVIEQCRSQEEVQLADERLWPPVRDQHLTLAKLFLKFEGEWRARFPNTKTVARELKVEGFWDLSAGGPVKSETAVKFSGRLDRVDSDSQGRYAVIDYKASGGSARNWGSWLKNHSIQLPFYAMLVEEGFTELPPGEVAAANFYVVKDSDRKKGFVVQEEAPELYEIAPRARNTVKAEDKQQLFQDMKSEINRALQAMADGMFNPQPRDQKTCASCSWRKQCRAQHLN